METNGDQLIDEFNEGAKLPPKKTGPIISGKGMTREQQDEKINQLLEKLGIDRTQTIEEVIFNKKKSIDQTKAPSHQKPGK